MVKKIKSIFEKATRLLMTAALVGGSILTAVMLMIIALTGTDRAPVWIKNTFNAYLVVLVAALILTLIKNWKKVTQEIKNIHNEI